MNRSLITVIALFLASVGFQVAQAKPVRGGCKGDDCPVSAQNNGSDDVMRTLKSSPHVFEAGLPKTVRRVERNYCTDEIRNNSFGHDQGASYRCFVWTDGSNQWTTVHTTQAYGSAVGLWKNGMKIQGWRAALANGGMQFIPENRTSPATSVAEKAPATLPSQGQAVKPQVASGDCGNTKDLRAMIRCAAAAGTKGK
jgi:hypothetical protein